MSEQVGLQASLQDPEHLLRQARALLSPDGFAGDVKPVKTPADALRQAYELVNADLAVLDRLKQSKVEPEYANLFGPHRHEKTAALLFLAQQKLLSLAGGSTDGDAHRELALYVEILFRMHAADALMLLYDVAAAHETDAASPTFWRNAAARCLYLLSLLADARAPAVAFLAERPAARQRLEELAASANPEIAHPARLLAQAVRGAVSTADVAPAPYIAIFVREYADVGRPHPPPPISAEEQEALELDVMEKVRAALENDEVADIAAVMAHGSQAEVRLAFDAITSFVATELYTDILEEVLQAPGVAPERLAAVALELGRLNRASGVRGGALRINRLLHDMASTVMADYVGVARLAVRELASVGALIDIERLMTEAPLLPVSEEAITALKDSRVLSTNSSFLENRPDLRPAFLAARAELLEVKSLMESAFAAATEEIARDYLNRLQEMHALPELRKLSQGNSRISQLALQLLAAMEHWR